MTNKTVAELRELAKSVGIENYSKLKKDQLIEALEKVELKKENSEKEPLKEEPEDAVGILEVLADGFGFLRFENYKSSEQDVYVSPTQIRRFNLKTGDEILGDCRPSTDEDKFSPLLYVKKIRGVNEKRSAIIEAKR